MTPIQIVLCCIIGLMALFIINGQIYLRSERGWMKWLYHDICRWHVPEEDSIEFVGVTWFARCKHCRQAIYSVDCTDWQRW